MTILVNEPGERKERRGRVRLWLVAAAALCCFLAAVASPAAEVYVVRFLMVLEPGACPGVSIYRDQLFFRNTTSQDLTVRASGGSNGYQPPSDPLVVPAGRSRSISIGPFDLGGNSNAWTPVGPFVLMVNRLELPDGIAVESRGEALGKGVAISCSPFAIGAELFGTFPLPVVRGLTPADTPEFHLDSGIGTLTSVTNVGTYNGGAGDATVRIEIRAACDDRLLEARMVSVPAATLIYTTGFRSTFAATSCFGSRNAADYSRYVVVTMDRPGFSFVVTRADALPPALPITSSLSR